MSPPFYIYHFSGLTAVSVKQAVKPVFLLLSGKAGNVNAGNEEKNSSRARFGDHGGNGARGAHIICAEHKGRQRRSRDGGAGR